MKTIIIGGVAGGATAAARLRRLDEQREIIIFERGGYISYANCGLPYYIGGVIAEKQTVLLQTPENMRAKYNIDVRVNSNVTRIDREKKTVTVLTQGRSYEESYDDLIIATGSSPIKPRIPGIEAKGVHVLWTVEEAEALRSIVDREKPKTAVVVGGGFIGLEVAENLNAKGIATAIAEAADQVMTPVDPEMARLLHENINQNGVRLYLKNGVSSFREEGAKTVVTLQSGTELKADLVVLSIGIRPNSILAKEAGLAVNERGGIITDDHMRTADPHIYAVGDAVESTNLVTDSREMITLAGPANKQGRVAADNLGGRDAVYEGSIATSVVKVFDLTVAATGLNEKSLMARGMEKNKDYYSIVINQKSHAGYYPLATQMFLKLLFAPDGKIFGACIVGQDGVDKRIDTIATTMRLGGNVHDLAKLELAYAPPYSSAKDPVNMLGFVAENVLEGLVRFRSYDELEDRFILDVTEDMERALFSIPGSYHIPQGQVRARLNELPRDREIVVYCAIGVRSYNSARVLMNNGFTDVSVLAGGTSFYKSQNYEIVNPPFEESGADAANPAPAGASAGTTTGTSAEATAGESAGEGSTWAAWAATQGAAGASSAGAEREIRVLNCTGLQCPGPIMKVNAAVKEMADGQLLQVSATDLGFARDIESWCKRTGNTYISTEKRGVENLVTIRKGTGAPEAQTAPAPAQDGNVPAQRDAAGTPLAAPAPALPQGKTIIVFDGDFDKAMASFIIANGAAAMGRPVTMFFTFWGLSLLRKDNKVPVQKTFVEKMFGAMMPRGFKRAKLSKMNMMGMGTKMMQKVMKDKNVTSLEDLVHLAMEAGVKIVACTMTMDIMGIKPEELIDGVELAGVATYLGDAENANVNLFI